MSLNTSIIDNPVLLAAGALTGALLGPAAAATSIASPDGHWPWQRKPGRWLLGEPATARRRVLLTLGGSAVLGSLAAVSGWRPAVLAFLVMGIIGSILTVIDLEHHRLPDRLVGAAAVGSMASLAVDATVTGSWAALVRGLLCAAVAFVMFFGMALISPRGMGFGDVKVAALLSLHTGWLSWELAVIALLAGFVVGALTSLALVVARQVSLQTAIPFGPALLVGAWLVVIATPTVG